MSVMLAKYSTYFVCKILCVSMHSDWTPQNSHQFPRPFLVWDVISFGISCFYFSPLHAIDTHTHCTRTNVLEHIVRTDLINLASLIPFRHPPYSLHLFVHNKWMRIESVIHIIKHTHTQVTNHYILMILLSLAIKSHFVIYFNECNFINSIWLNVFYFY